MRIRIINQSQAMQLITMDACIGVMEKVLTQLARGKAVMPLRTVMWTPDKAGVLATMPAHLEQPPVMGLKVIAVFPGNATTEYESHQGGVLLFDTQNGLPLAMIEASAITAIRTAAVSAVATRYLAQKAAGDLAILGSGTQARSHLEAMLLVRPIHRVRVWSRHAEHAHRFIRDAARHTRIPIEFSEQVENAVAGADIICTTTTAPEPILSGKAIAQGAHINAVGACLPNTRELDSEAVCRSRLFVDRRESAIHESGDFLIPRKEGLITADHIIGELGELTAGMITGRRSETDITLFKSLGLAVEDVAAAYHIFKNAEKINAGVTADFGGLRNTCAKTNLIK